MKTAVQLIKEKLESMSSIRMRLSDFDEKNIFDLIDLSIEREKQQIINAYKAGFIDSQKPSKDLKKEFNDYYTDNFH